MLFPSKSTLPPRSASDVPSPFSEHDLESFSFTLEETVQGYEKLLALLQEEKGFIIESDHDALLRCVARKEARLLGLSELEKRRQEILGRIFPKQPSMTLKTLIPSLPLPYRERLIHSHARLEALTASIQEINEINGLLVHRVLGQISGLLKLLQQMSLSGATYQATGRFDEIPLHSRSIARG